MQAQMQEIMFMKNIALIGTGLILAHFGAGPLSVDSRKAALEQGPKLQPTH
jgi:uncharacterized membrane protein YphA (DoxX/SURF4 family)